MPAEITRNCVEQEKLQQRRDDLQLAEAASRGDNAARREVAERLFSPVRRTTGYMLSSVQDAEDLAQDALVNTLRSLSSFRGDSSLEYWADRIVVRTVMKQVHKHRRRERLSDAMKEPEISVVGPEDIVSSGMARRQLTEQLQKLSVERRMALVLHHVEGYGISEIADITDTPQNTVRDRLRKGRKQLRKKILADPVLRGWVKAMEL